MFKRVARSLTVPVIAFLLSGCSVLVVQGPPQVSPGAAGPPVMTCTTSKWVPLVDLGAGVASGGGGTLVAVANLNEGDMAYGLAWAGVGTAQIVSGILGLRRVNACRDAIADFTAGPPLSPPRSMSTLPNTTRRVWSPETGLRPGLALPQREEWTGNASFTEARTRR